jgi:sortase B
VEYWEASKIDALAAIHDQAAEDSQGESSDADRSGGEPASFEQLAAINGDYLGWLTVGGGVVDLPVVLGADNDFYLKHDFYSNVSSYGTLFADCLTQREQAGNLLIYGHHMKNGSMFGSLKSYADLEFFENHSQITWETAAGVAEYELFAVLVVPGEEDDPEYLSIRDYLGQVSTDRQEQLLSELRSRAQIWRDVQVEDDDRLLFLMTCDYTKTNGRLLLCAVKSAI